MRFLQIFFDFIKSHLTFIVPPDYLIFLQDFEDWLTSSSQVRYEVGYVIKTAQESSNFLFRMGDWHFLDVLYLGKINFDAFFADNKT